jgi:hypothetical protein
MIFFFFYMLEISGGGCLFGFVGRSLYCFFFFYFEVFFLGGYLVVWGVGVEGNRGFII